MDMSKPQFSRKRKGKKVDPYPLGGKGKSKSSQTKKNAGRPKKPVEVEDFGGYRDPHYEAAADALSGHLEVLEDDGDPTDMVKSALAQLEAGEDLGDEELKFVSEYMTDDAEDLDPEDWPNVGPAAKHFEEEMKRRGQEGLSQRGRLEYEKEALVDEYEHLAPYGKDRKRKKEIDREVERIDKLLASGDGLGTVYNTPESIDDLQERGYALAFDFPDKESAQDQVEELQAQGHSAKIIPINNFSEYEVWAKQKQGSYSLGDRVLALGTWYTVDGIAESGTLELVDENTMETLFLQESQFHTIEDHEK